MIRPMSKRPAAHLFLTAAVGGALALAVAAPGGAVAAREKPAKGPNRLWQEFPLGKTLSQPSRTTAPPRKSPRAAATLARSKQTPSAAPKRARRAEQTRPAPAPAPAPAPGEGPPLDLRGKGQGTTFSDFALVIGYASGAVLLVLGGMGITARVRRSRRSRLAEAAAFGAGSPVEPEVTAVGGIPDLEPAHDTFVEGEDLSEHPEVLDPDETLDVEPAETFGEVGERAEEPDTIPLTLINSPEEPDVTDVDETPDAESEDRFVQVGDTREEPLATHVDEPDLEPADSVVEEAGEVPEEPAPTLSILTGRLEDLVATRVDELPVAEAPDGLVEEVAEMPEATAPTPSPVAGRQEESVATYADEMHDLPPTDDSFTDVGDRIATILQTAREAAENIRREAIEEAATIRSQAEKDAAARYKQLTAEIERVNSESQVRAQALREEGERYVAERLLEADAEAERMKAEAESEAQARRAAAEDAARIEDEARRRQAVLKEAALALEHRLRGALEGIQHVSNDLEETLLEELPQTDQPRRDLAV
jgi:hypothetical protein